MDKIIEVLKDSYQIIVVGFLIFLLWLLLAGCTTAVYVPANQQHPNVVPCPNMQPATPGTWAQDMLNRNEDYEMCKIQTDVIIKFIKGVK